MFVWRSGAIHLAHLFHHYKIALPGIDRAEAAENLLAAQRGHRVELVSGDELERCIDAVRSSTTAAA